MGQPTEDAAHGGHVTRVLFVCTGNICRSPMAESVARHRSAGSGVEFSSAGTHALQGRPMTDQARSALREVGLRDDGHRAKQLDRALLDAADWVYAMEHHHLLRVLTLRPELDGNAKLLDPEGRPVPDPYGLPATVYRESLHQIVSGLEARALDWTHRSQG